jgi:hypothetical protein
MSTQAELENNLKLYGIAFNVIKHLSSEAEKSHHEEQRANMVNLQYTLKILYERHEATKHSLDNLTRLKKESPLWSSVHGKSFTANEAIDFLKNIAR